jgi:hypothetical protein
MRSPTNDSSRVMSPDSLVSDAPPGSNTPAVESASLGISLIAPTFADAMHAPKTITPNNDSTTNTTKPAPVITDSDLDVTPSLDDMPPTLENLKQSLEDEPLEPDPPYL